MNLILKRNSKESSGIYSTLTTEDGTFVASCLEHAYYNPNVKDSITYVAKLQNGLYVCERGHHQLHSGPIETFEITGVPGHTGVLLHPGNTEAASEGCVLLGSQRVANSVINSKVTFAKFMDLQSGVDEFKLTVEG